MPNLELQTENVTIETANLDNAKSGIKDSQSTDDDKTENVTVDTAYCDNAKSGINDREINNCDNVDNIDIETSKCDFVETSFNNKGVTTTNHKTSNTKNSNRNRRSVSILEAQKVKNKYSRCKKNLKSSEKKKEHSKPESSDGHFSSSDDIPLKFVNETRKLKTRQKKERHTQLFEGDNDDEVIYDSEDSYKPNKKDQNSSDSEFSPSDGSEEEDTQLQYPIQISKERNIKEMS